MLAVRFLCALGMLFVLGCTSTKTSNTARTGTEQLLISNAVDQALAKVDFRPLTGKKVMIEDKYLEGVDKGYIISSIRHQVLHNGGHLTAKPEEAEIILELRSGGVGTDTSDSYLGMPGLTLPGMVSLPDVKLVTRSRQSAFAKLGIVAIDVKSQGELGNSGVSLAMSDDNNWYVMGVGPYRQGTMKREVESSIETGWVTDAPIPLPTAISFSRPSTPARNVAREEPSGRIQLTSGEEPEQPADPTVKTKPATKSAEVVPTSTAPASADATSAPAKTAPAGTGAETPDGAASIDAEKSLFE